MENRNLSTLLLLAVVGLLIWNGLGARPVAIAAPAAEAEEATGSISVSGSSAIRVQPDRVVVRFGVQTFKSTPRTAQAENARLARAVIAALRAQGVAQHDIATAHLSIDPAYEDYDRGSVNGYYARNSLAVTLRDVQLLEPVLVTALEAGATTIDGVDFSTTNLRALRDRAREQAVRAAREKAAAMADAAGMALGDVTSISENSWTYYFGSWYGNRQWTNTQNVIQDLSAEGAITLEDGSISLGQIVVQAEVSLTAELVGR